MNHNISIPPLPPPVQSVALYDRPVSSPKRPDLVVDSTGEALLVPRGTLDTFLMKHPKHQQSSTSTTSTSTSKLPAFKTRSTTVSSTAAKKGRMTKQAKSKFDVAENEEMLDWEQEDRYSSDEYDNHDGFGGRDGDNDDEELGEDDDAVARAKRKGKQVASFSSSNNNNS